MEVKFMLEAYMDSDIPLDTVAIFFSSKRLPKTGY